MKHLRTFIVTLALAVGLAASVAAQTTVTSTTLSNAATDSATTLVVASATGFDAGDIAFVDREAMRVVAVSGTNITVQRGWAGTAAAAHAATSVIYVGAPDNYSQILPAGSCTSTAEAYLPRIVLPQGKVFQCSNSRWIEVGADLGTIVASFVQGATPADALDTIFFIADRDYLVTKIEAIWGTAESTGSMDIMVEKLTGTTACASGTDLQASAIAGTGTANTVNTATLSATASALFVSAGNRLCVDLTATPNEVANMVVNVTLAPR